MLHVGLDLSRRRLDFHALDERGATVAVDATPPDADGLAALARRFAGAQVRAAIESMNGARFVHDQLELAGWQVEIADAARVKGLAPLACKTDRIDARVLAELSWRELVPTVWLPDPSVRAERERARFRLHLVRHRTSLKNRVHATLLAHGVPCPVSDLFGVSGRTLLERLQLPDVWRGTLEALGESDRRGSLSKQGPRYLRWALIEATSHACRHPAYATRYQQTRRRLGKQRGPKVARVQLARTLAHAIWHMLSRNHPFAPKSATDPLAA